MSEKIRIQKYLSQKGIFSRRECESYIRAKRIAINGELATLGDRVNDTDVIWMDGEALAIKKTIERRVLAFYKPVGVESTLKAEYESETLADFDFKGRVFPIGRLDKNSHGLLLMTNDGDLSNRLAHPKYQKEKEYLVVVNKPITGVFLKQMSKGVALRKKKITTKPCVVEKIEDQIFKIVLTEGKNRQIRRMCEELGFEVKDLLRIRIGNCYLGEMKPGRYRVLGEKEIKSLTFGSNLKK